MYDFGLPCIGYLISNISDSPVTVKMRIRHYFGNSSPNSTNDRGRQDDPMQELEKDENSDRIKTSTNSKVDDGSKVSLFRTSPEKSQV